MDLSQPSRLGDVIRYSYLWADEAHQGHEEGLKDRPVAVVAAILDGNLTRVVVLPITHTQPSGDTVSVPIPHQTCKRLGLDDDQSWIVVSEFNYFVWPGFDIRPIPHKNDKFIYGALPRGLSKQIIEAWKEAFAAKKTTATPRT